MMIENLRGKRILICEEALIDYKGHFYSWIKAIRTLHRNAGVEVLVACSKDVNESIKKEFNAFPVYTYNNWSGIYDGKQAWKRYLSVFKHNYRVWKETRAFLKTIGKVDCILLPAVRIHQLMAWRRLCSESLGKRFDRLILFVLNSEAVYDEGFTQFHFKKTSLLIKIILRSFKNYVAQGKVVLAGDSHITSHEFETLAGVPFRVFPSPALGLEAIHSDQLSQPDEFTNTTTFVILGVSFIDKGIDVLQKAIVLLLKENPLLPARFVIQWAREMVDYDGKLVPISETLRNAKQVELIENVLSEEAYKQYMHEADFIVLPYRLKVYFNRISGVAVEAACAGIPMIVTQNSWLEWAIKEYGAGVSVKDGDYNDLADKIKYCIAHKNSLIQEAEQRKATAIEKNSSAYYLDCVWK